MEAGLSEEKLPEYQEMLPYVDTYEAEEDNKSELPEYTKTSSRSSKSYLFLEELPKCEWKPKYEWKSKITKSITQQDKEQQLTRGKTSCPYSRQPKRMKFIKYIEYDEKDKTESPYRGDLKFSRKGKQKI